MANTTYFKNLVAGNLFHIDASNAVPASYYLGLSSTEPQADGTGATEPAGDGSGYARVLLNGLGNLTDGKVSNTAEITFPKSITEWFSAAAPATYFAVYDGDTQDANLLFYGQLTDSRIIQTNTYARWPSGAIEIQVI